MCNYIEELLKAPIWVKSSLLQILLLWLDSMMSHKARCPTEGLFKLNTSKNAASIKSFIYTAGFFSLLVLMTMSLYQVAYFTKLRGKVGKCPYPLVSTQ